MPRLLLVQPSHRSGAGGALVKQRKLHLPGLAFPLLAALAPAHWQVDIRLELIEDIDFDDRPDLVGIGAMGHALFRGMEIAQAFRARGIPVFFGGAMASLVPWLLKEAADSVVIGDAEAAFPRLLADFETGRPLRPVYDLPVESLAGLPVPRYELLTAKRIGRMLPVQAGRGCHHACTFCSIAAIYRRRYLHRPIPEVVRDIVEVRRLGFRQFLLIDDNIVSDPTYFLELCRAIEPLGMTWASQCAISIAEDERLLAAARRSGCRILSFGLETVRQEGLDALEKPWVRTANHAELLERVAAAGILPSTEMMVGLDGDTEASLDATLDFVRKTRLPIPRFYVLTPIPGTALFDQMKREGRLLHEDLGRFTGYHCVHEPRDIPSGVLDRKYDELNRRVYALGSVLRRTLLNPHILRNPWAYLFAFFVNLQYHAHIRRNDIPVVF
jgi:radical SAM superfamily enzyme YgiQ (UPF0313 family)